MRIFGLFLGVVFLTLLVLGAIALAPVIPQHVPARLILPTAIGIALLVAAVFHLVRLFIEDISRRAEAGYDPMKIAQDFNNRTLGMSELPELAATSGAVLENWLRTQRAAWWLLTPRDNIFEVMFLPARGDLPPAPSEFSRNNPLLRQLGLERRPLSRPNFKDAKYANMLPEELAWLNQLRAEVFVPLFDGGVLSTVLLVGERANHLPYEAADLEALKLITGQAAAALKTARVIADLKNLNASMTALNASLSAANETMQNMNSVRGDFLAIASHELRTPITQMLGFADLLGSMAQDDQIDKGTVVEITDSIVRACGRLNEVIGQILDMAQIDVEAMDLKFEDTQLDEVLRLSIEPYVAALKERNVRLGLSGLKNLPPLRVDKHRLVQAFGQILSNAIKFTPDGGQVNIAIRLLPPHTDQPPQIEIVFADTGIGIDAKHQQLIFQKFYRVGSAAVHSTGTTKFMGAGPGLGLPIAKGVVGGHGGRIWVESPGHDPVKFPGSKFFVVLPIKPPAFAPQALADSEVARRPAKREVTIVPSKNPFVGME